MGIDNKDLVTRLLKQSILSLCRETVAYTRRLEIDGIICLTVDDQDQHVVKIHEFFGRPHVSENETNHVKHMPTETKYQSESATHEIALEHCERRSTSSTQEKSEKNISHRIKVEADNNLIKTSLGDDSYANSRVTQERKGLPCPTLSVTDVKPENDISHQIKLEADNIVIKPDPDAEVKQEDESVKGIMQQQDSKSNTCSDNLPYDDYTDLAYKKVSKSSATNIVCKKCKSTLEDVDLFHAHNMASHNLFTCLVCLATFTSRSNLKRHFNMHTGMKRFSCSKCPESFYRYDDVKRHMLKHTFQKTYRCALCKLGCSNKEVVKSHMLKAHNSHVYHVCPHCGESYIDIVRFQQHKKIHSVLQDYRCSICSFTGSSALMYNKHMLTHGPLKEYKCTHCDLSFPDPFMYTSHMKGHRDDERVQEYNCCFCSKTFQTFEKFQKHEHTHVRSKHHVCEICNKKFRSPSNLKEHILTHQRKPSSSDARNLPPTPEHVSDNHFKSKTKKSCTNIGNDKNSSVDLSRIMTNKNNCKKISDNSAKCLENKNEFMTEHPEKNKSKDNYSDKRKQIIDLCEDSTQPGPKHNHVYNDETVEDNREMFNTFEDSTQNETPQHCIYKEETVADDQMRSNNPYEDSTQTDLPHDNIYSKVNTKSFNGNIRKNVQTKTLQNTSENNIKQHPNNITDAIRQVKDIQSKYGMKSVNQYQSKAASQKVQDRKRQLDDNSTISKVHKLSKHSAVKSSSRNSTILSDQQIFKSTTGGKDSHIFRNEDYVNEMFPQTKIHPSNAEQICSGKKSSILGMKTIKSPTFSPLSTPNRKISNQGSQKVVTPYALFKTRHYFKCDICMETFNCFDAYDEHGIKTHRNFICSYCGKGLTTKSNRERHIRIHTGEKIYTCEVCREEFHREDDLKNHKEMLHTVSEPIKCGACQASFSLPHDLEKHLQVHPDHKL